MGFGLPATNQGRFYLKQPHTYIYTREKIGEVCPQGGKNHAQGGENFRARSPN